MTDTDVRLSDKKVYIAYVYVKKPKEFLGYVKEIRSGPLLNGRLNSLSVEITDKIWEALVCDSEYLNTLIGDMCSFKRGGKLLNGNTRSVDFTVEVREYKLKDDKHFVLY